MYILFALHKVPDFITTSRSAQRQTVLFTFRRHSPEMCLGARYSVVFYCPPHSHQFNAQRAGYLRQTTLELLPLKYTPAIVRVQLLLEQMPLFHCKCLVQHPAALHLPCDIQVSQ